MPVGVHYHRAGRTLPPSLKRSVEHAALAVDAGAGTLDSWNDCLLLWTPQQKALELVGAESETC